MRGGRARRGPIGAAFLAGASCFAWAPGALADEPAASDAGAEPASLSENEASASGSLPSPVPEEIAPTATAPTPMATTPVTTPIGAATAPVEPVKPPGATPPDDPDELRRQRFELAGFGGIGMGGDFDQPIGRVDFEDGASFAGLLAARISGPFFFELSYSRRPSALTVQPSGEPAGDPSLAVDDDIALDVGIEYYQVGATYRWSSPVRWLTPLIGITLGASRIDAVPDAVSDYWGFAWAPLAGVQFDIAKYVALRPQVRFLFTDITKGNEIFCGDQPNCDAGTRTVISVQTDMALGLVFKI